MSVQASPPPLCSDAGVSFINGLQHNWSFRPRSQRPNFLSFDSSLSCTVVLVVPGLFLPLLSFLLAVPAEFHQVDQRGDVTGENVSSVPASQPLYRKLSLSVCLTLSLSVTLPNRAVSLTALSLSRSGAKNSSRTSPGQK